MSKYNLDVIVMQAAQARLSLKLAISSNLHDLQ